MGAGRVATVSHVPNEFAPLNVLAGPKIRSKHHIAVSVMVVLAVVVIVEVGAQRRPAIVAVDPKSLSLEPDRP
jgi:hypothetical protein